MALVVFTGGARSGKSAAASRLARVRTLDGHQVVVAVFGSATDAEMERRIERHRADRPMEFVTLEAADSESWLDEVDAEALLLVDCLGTLLGRCMLEAAGSESLPDDDADLPARYVDHVAEAFDRIVGRIASRRGDTIVVTNEVGDGVVPAYASSRLFRDLLGHANRTLVGEADAAYLCVAGRLLELTARPADASWPHD